MIRKGGKDVISEGHEVRLHPYTGKRGRGIRLGSTHAQEIEGEEH